MNNVKFTETVKDGIIRREGYDWNRCYKIVQLVARLPIIGKEIAFTYTYTDFEAHNLGDDGIARVEKQGLEKLAKIARLQYTRHCRTLAKKSQ